MPGALVYTGGTTDSGVSPLAARAAFCTPNLTESIVDSMAMLARWGVMTTLSRSSNGLSGGVGSVSVTSRPAAFITPALSARVNAASSTTGPRHVFIRIAVGFIMPNSRSEMR